jgi:two-component system, NarL family, invasion response regulator UvrY
MNILICEDHVMFRDGIKKALQRVAGVKCVDEAGNYKEGMALLNQKEYNVVLLDISLPGKSGIDMLEKVKTTWPETRVLMLSMYPEEEYGLRCILLGASGYLNKDVDPLVLVDAINKVAHGGQYISDKLATILASNYNKNKVSLLHEMLSDREFDIMLKLAGGVPYADISSQLHISKDTIGTYRSRIMNKMGFTKNAELTQYCLQNKLLL